MSSPATEIAYPAVEALVLLPFAELPDDRRRGAVCLWDGVPLSADTAIDLGERQADDGTSWFPRGCRACVLAQAMRALQLHTQSCEQCTDDFTQCLTGHGLVRLMREARR